MCALIAPCTGSRLPGAPCLYHTPYHTMYHTLFYIAPYGHNNIYHTGSSVTYHTAPYHDVSQKYHFIGHKLYFFVPINTIPYYDICNTPPYNAIPYPGARRPEGSNQLSQHIRRHLLLLGKETHLASKAAKESSLFSSCWGPVVEHCKN